MWVKLLVLIAILACVQARQFQAINRAVDDQLDDPNKAVLRILDGDKKKRFLALLKDNENTKKSDLQIKVTLQ
jgi:cell division protein YceG involved in septum cleavage